MENTLQIENHKSTVYCRPGHFSPLESMRSQGLLCDVTIEVGTTKFKAHKFILAATTRYFQNMFTNDFEEFRKEVISIKNVSDVNMKAFITFAYTGQITLTEDNVQSLIVDADYLDLIDIKKESIKFLESCLNVQNVCEVYRLAEALTCTSLKETSKKIMRQNFGNVSLTDDYLNIDFHLLKDILSSYDSQSYLQITVFKAVMRWILNDVDQRQMYLSELLKFIRITELSSEFLIDYFFKDRLTAIGHKHNELLTEVMCTFNDLRKRSLKNEKKYILAISTEDSNVIETYNPVSEMWELTTPIGNSRAWFGATLHKGELYIFGGDEDVNEDISNAQVYEPQNKIWKTISSMNVGRSFCGAAALHGFLYVCGGQTYTQYSNVVERYCPESDEWKTICPMNFRRSCLAVVPFQGYIYAIGGSDGPLPLATVERYDTQMNQWTTLNSEMKQKRNSCAAAVLNNKIYVCGGINESGRNILSSVEVYNPKTNRWEYVASMDSARCDLLVVAKKGKLWAIGGYDGKKNVSTVEVYDPNSNSWLYAAKPMSRIMGWVKGGVVSSC